MMDEDGNQGSPGRYAKGRATRQEIVDRTVEVLAQKGAQHTSLRAIAAEVGVTHAALTHYFGSLDNLLIEAYRQSDSSPSHLSDTSIEGPVEMMLRSARSNQSVPGLVQLYTALCAASLDDQRAEIRSYITDRFSRVRDDIATRVRGEQTQGRIRSDIDPDTVSALIVAASDGLQIQKLLDPNAPQTQALTLLDRLLTAPRKTDVDQHSQPKEPS